ncbi:MAG: hypothetical protein HYU77_03775 [Betaproteobacteria bacterium]|nr:hypothetical protein [Betaproteobacteria bacterium]
MELTSDPPPGATPLDPDESAGLIPLHIVTQEQLNAWEQQNILDAREWVFARKRKEVLSQSFLRELHKRMFGKTWKWAGHIRTRTLSRCAPRC